MSCKYRNKENVKMSKIIFFFLFKAVSHDLQNPNLMSIYVSRNRKPLIIQKKTGIFRVIEGLRIQLAKN